MLENLSSSRGNRSSKFENGSGLGSSYTTQKGKGAKPSYVKNKPKFNNKDKNKRENRWCSSIAAHNIDNSLLGPEFDPAVLEETRKSNKINLKSKTKKTPNSKTNENITGDISFQQNRTSVNLSKMFNNYANQPIPEK